MRSLMFLLFPPFYELISFGAASISNPEISSRDHTTTSNSSKSTPRTVAWSSNIPNDFRVDLDFPEGAAKLRPQIFYAICAHALLFAGLKNFYDSADGYHTSSLFGLQLRVTKSQSVYPHLQVSHIIWAIQYLAEEVSRNYKFQLSQGPIIFRGTNVGQLGLLRSSASAPSPSLRILDANIKSTNTVTKCEYSDIPSGMRLLAANLFLSVIRSMAIAAPTPYKEEYLDFETTFDDIGISVQLSTFLGRPKITREVVSIALTKVALDIAGREGGLVEKRVLFYEETDGVRTNDGELKILKAVASPFVGTASASQAGFANRA